MTALLSFGRRYWRKALKRRTQTPVAQQLKAVLKHNPRRARASCRKNKPGRGLREPCYGMICSHMSKSKPNSARHVLLFRMCFAYDYVKKSCVSSFLCRTEGASDPIMLNSDSEPERPIAQEWVQVGMGKSAILRTKILCMYTGILCIY